MRAVYFEEATGDVSTANWLVEWSQVANLLQLN
jgi:hypothetical protein